MINYVIPAIVEQAFPRAMKPGNILSGFRVIKYFVFDSDVFANHDFMHSEVTNRLVACIANNNISKHNTLYFQ